MSSNGPIEFRTLLLMAQSGEATDAQLQDLNERLRQDPKLREVVSEELMLDALLLEHHEGLDGACELDVLSGEGLFPSSDPHGVSTQTLVTSPLFWGVSLAVATVLTLMIGLTQSYLGRPAMMKEVRPPQAPNEQTRDELLATVTLSHEARWSPPKSLGDHIAAGEVQLLSGVGRIHTRLGTELLIDARSEPARMKFGADGTVNVDEGHVVVSVTEAELGFKLRTPTTKIVDIGTRFEVDVSSAGRSEVQVLDGAVTCLPVDAVAIKNESLLSAGEASAFVGPKDQAGTAIPRPISRYEDLELIRDELESSRGRQLAQEPFSYASGLLPLDSTGSGWEQGWHAHTQPDKPPVALVRHDGMMSGIPWVRRTSASYCVLPNASVSARQLAEPIDLNQDRVVYASFLMRKRRLAPMGTIGTGGGLTFMASRTADEDVAELDHVNIAFGLSFDHRDHFTASTGVGRYNSIAPIRLDVEQVYFVVTKLVLHKDKPDNIFAKVFTDRDPPRVTEPTQWDAIAPPHEHAGFLRKLHLWSNQNAIMAFDELRVGETWASVVPLHR
ncbi:MAG: FecR family protein [Planctomycetota bacterium]